MHKFACLAVAASAASSTSQSSLFDEGSDFMKGFDTGIMTRDRTDFEEFGCQTATKSGQEKIFAGVYLALNTVQPFIPDDELLEASFQSLMLYVDGISTLAMVMDPEAAQLNDDFCRGVQFGVKGTNVISKIAVQLRQAMKVDKTAERIKKTKRAQTEGTPGDKLKQMGRDILKNMAKNAYQNNEL